MTVQELITLLNCITKLNRQVRMVDGKALLKQDTEGDKQTISEALTVLLHIKERLLAMDIQLHS